MSTNCTHYLINRERTIVLVCLLFLFVGIRLVGLSCCGLWQDELFSLRVASLPWGGLIASLAADAVHPPLFYVLLKVWTSISLSDVWLKSLPLIFSILSICPIYLICTKLRFQFLEFLLAIWFISFNGFLVHYSQELRMYSLFMLLSLCSTSALLYLESSE